MVINNQLYHSDSNYFDDNDSHYITRSNIMKLIGQYKIDLK